MPIPAFHSAHPSSDQAAGFVDLRSESPLAQTLLRPLLDPTQERIVLLAFDPDDRLVRYQDAAGESEGRCTIPYQCWKDLLQPNVVSVIMAHNHPSGIAYPSDADRQCTVKASTMLELLGIRLTDHLIFVTRGHFSFRKAGLL